MVAEYHKKEIIKQSVKIYLTNKYEKNFSKNWNLCEDLKIPSSLTKFL